MTGDPFPVVPCGIIADEKRVTATLQASSLAPRLEVSRVFPLKFQLHDKSFKSSLMT